MAYVHIEECLAQATCNVWYQLWLYLTVPWWKIQVIAKYFLPIQYKYHFLMIFRTPNENFTYSKRSRWTDMKYKTCSMTLLSYNMTRKSMLRKSYQSCLHFFQISRKCEKCMDIQAIFSPYKHLMNMIH